MRIVGAAPVHVTVIGNPLANVDAVAAASDAKGFFDADALPVRPGQRHDQLVGIAELVGSFGALEDRVVIGFGAIAEGVEPGADEPEFAAAGIEQLHEHVGLVFGDRVIQQPRLLQRAAFGADLEIEDVSKQADRVGARLDVCRRRLCQRWRGVCHGWRGVCHGWCSGVFGRQRRGAELLGRLNDVTVGRGRAGSWLRTIVRNPGLVGHP